MNKKIANKLTVLTIIAISVFFTFCNDQYENRSLAFRNNTNDSIQVDRYYSNSIRPRTVMIAPDEYDKFFETSSDLWVSPQVEMEKVCDSVIITGLVNGNDFRIKFRKDDIKNYCTSPYSANAEWETLIKVEEHPKFLGKTLERFYIHIFDINSTCITVN